MKILPNFRKWFKRIFLISFFGHLIVLPLIYLGPWNLSDFIMELCSDYLNALWPEAINKHNLDKADIVSFPVIILLSAGFRWALVGG